MVRKLKLKESNNSEVVLSSDLFDVVEVEGTDINNKPYNELRIESKGLANRCAVEVTLDSDWFSKYHEQEDVTFVKYYGAKVGWGMSSKPVNVDDMIYCLEEAKKFADRLNQWLIRYGRKA